MATHRDRDEKRSLLGEPIGASRALKLAVSVEDLEEFRRSEAAQRLTRLEADSELMLRLSVEGFDGVAWREVSQALVEYGYTVMRAWVATGQVFVKLRERGRGVADPPLGRIPRDDAIMLAEDSVADGIVDFRDRVLKQGYWDPSKGASLTTFFIGNCLLFQFPNLYRSWRKDRIEAMRSDSLSGFDDDMRPRQPWAGDPAVAVADADAASRKIRQALDVVEDPTNQAIVWLDGEGFGIDEIAETLGLGYGAVESRLYRSRKKLRRAGGS
ncbi:MAG: hypothetical protein H0T94_13040 [Acidimicrobiia bacterium]|nr:hypothetical protein [Acidimicrobiia bacterium]